MKLSIITMKVLVLNFLAVRRAFRALARADHLVSERFLTVNTFCDTSDRELVSMFHRKVDAEKKTYRC